MLDGRGTKFTNRSSPVRLGGTFKMGKTNRKGRAKHDQYVKLHRGVTGSAAWKDLSCVARCMLIEIWTRHNGMNNGRIHYSHKEARVALKVGSRKITQAFRELEEHGFLIAVTRGSFNFKAGAGQGKATEWEITAEPCDGKPLKGLYRKWTKNQNTGTTLVTTGNSSGYRSANRPSPNSSDGDQSSSRNQQKDQLNGIHTSCTYIIPRRGRNFSRLKGLNHSFVNGSKDV